jgi:hypothetical protein
VIGSNFIARTITASALRMVGESSTISILDKGLPL